MAIRLSASFSITKETRRLLIDILEMLREILIVNIAVIRLCTAKMVFEEVHNKDISECACLLKNISKGYFKMIPKGEVY